MKKIFLVILVLFTLTITLPIFAEDSDEIKFTSVPDLFNWNIDNPQEKWEDALNWFFNHLQKDGPDFTLNAGDIMDARWWKGADQIESETNKYWLGFKKRFDDRGMKVYIAPGDHEYGDDIGLSRGDIARKFGSQFSKLMNMPLNGPENHKGRAFWVRNKNLLLISLDTFEDAGKKFDYTVGEMQLKWMKEVLEQNRDAEFIIVQGHLPIIGPVKSKNSSASMLEEGQNSKLWKLMVEYKVDAYFCGEHHRITVIKKDDIWQIVHGALWGTQKDLNYLRGKITTNSDKNLMELELMEFTVDYKGGRIGNHPHRAYFEKPREEIILTNQTKNNGPISKGKLVIEIQKNGEKKELLTTGYFN